jgi:hypothetical protein
MTNYDYLIIGGGMTAAAAVDGIREVDPTGGIGMISGGAGRSLQPSSPLESALERQALGQHLAQDGSDGGSETHQLNCETDLRIP